MKKYIKKYWLVVVISLIVLTFIVPSKNALDNTKFEENLNSILPQKGSEFNFTKTVIDLSALIDPEMNITLTENRINVMADNLKRLLDNNIDPEVVSARFNEYLFDTLHFSFDFEANKYLSGTGEKIVISRDELLNFNSIGRVVHRKRGICISISIVYLIMAEKLDLPIYGVLVPGHIYVRYKEKGKPGVNIETTVNGIEIYDYEAMSNIEFLDKDKMIYGKEIDNYATIGAYLNNLGYVMHLIGQRGKAKIFYKKSIEMVPDFSEPYNNLATLFEEAGKNEKTEVLYAKAVEINPNMVSALVNLGRFYYDEKRFIKSEEFFGKALSVDKRNTTAREYLHKIKSGESK